MNQGRCKACRLRYVWAPIHENDSGVKVGEAFCPSCSKPLERTTSHCRDRLVHVSIPDVAASLARCMDCGADGERTGHQTCPFPGRFSDPNARNP